jgi:hypothetical protein
MNPQKKLLQLDLAKDILLAEITGIRASGQVAGTEILDYATMYENIYREVEAVTDFMEEEATKNMADWQVQQSGLANPEVANEEK